MEHLESAADELSKYLRKQSDKNLDEGEIDDLEEAFYVFSDALDGIIREDIEERIEELEKLIKEHRHTEDGKLVKEVK